MKKISVSTAVPAKMASVSAVVTRCGCTHAQKERPDWHARRGESCPRPLAIEDHGVVAYWHRNPLRRWWWHMKQAVTSFSHQGV